MPSGMKISKVAINLPNVQLSKNSVWRTTGRVCEALRGGHGHNDRCQPNECFTKNDE